MNQVNERTDNKPEATAGEHLEQSVLRDDGPAKKAGSLLSQLMHVASDVGAFLETCYRGVTERGQSQHAVSGVHFDAESVILSHDNPSMTREDIKTIEEHLSRHDQRAHQVAAWAQKRWSEAGWSVSQWRETLDLQDKVLSAYSEGYRAIQAAVHGYRSRLDEIVPEIDQDGSHAHRVGDRRSLNRALVNLIQNTDMFAPATSDLTPEVAQKFKTMVLEQVASFQKTIDGVAPRLANRRAEAS